MNEPLPPSTRAPLHGTRQILRFNGPFYLSAAAIAVVGVLVLRSGFLPSWLAWFGWAGLGLLLWWVVASLVASWYVYDFSPLMTWSWVPQMLTRKPEHWVNLHAGLDESTPTLRHLFGTTGDVWDFYDPKTMTEPSIEKARREVPEADRALSVRTNALPAADNTVDAAFLFFAAHEIRDKNEREVFWDELARVMDWGGHIVVAEHLRDTANFIAFGPGFFHFLPRAEWLRLFKRAGFAVRIEWAITPFTRVFVLQKPFGSEPDESRL